jgi:hypothetical protein
MTPEDDNAPPWDDPIVSEVRKAREAIFAAAYYDLDKLSQRLRQQQADSGRPVATRVPRRPNHHGGEAA